MGCNKEIHTIKNEKIPPLGLKCKKAIFAGILAFAAITLVNTGYSYSAYASDNIGTVSEVEKGEKDDLSDTLQHGGLGISDNDNDSPSLASAYDETALDACLTEGFRKYSASIDVSDIGLPLEEARNGAIRAVINAHPEIIGINDVTYYYSAGTGNVTRVDVTYCADAKSKQRELDNALETLARKVDISGMTDEEIVLAYHEYLTSTVAYAYEAYLTNTLGEENEYDMYGALVKHSAVCQGYAETMFYLLKQAGIPCSIVSSANINHAWNVVKIHGNWYHIDVTWDDPVWDVPGKSLHRYFLVSFPTMNTLTAEAHNNKDRSDMVISVRGGETYTAATDTTYESGKFWNGVTKMLFCKDGYWYTIGKGSGDTTYQISKYKYSTGSTQNIYSGTAKWMASENSYYPGQYGAIYIQGNNLYFSTPDSLNKIDLSITPYKATEIVNIRSSYSIGNNMYALGEQYGKLVYAVASSPKLDREKDSTDSTKYIKKYDEYTVDICTSHIWDAGVVVTEPTYKTEGTKKYTCTNCGETKTESIDKLICTEHVWDAGVVVTAPTYKTEGTRKYTCTSCGEIKTEKISRLHMSETVIKAVNDRTGIKLTWSRIAGAEGYKIYRKNLSSGYKLIKTLTSAQIVAMADNSVKAGVTYSYKIVPYNSNVNGGEKVVSILRIGNTTTKTVNVSNGVRVSWNKASGVNGYNIYRKTANGGYVRIKVVKASVNAYTDRGVRSSSVYTYMVKPYKGSSTGTCTTSKITYIKTPKASAGVVKNGIKVKWSNVSGAKNYRVYRRTSSGKWATLKTVTARTSSLTDTKAKKGVTYLYSVRALNGKTYSAMSPSVKVKRK
ncbi:MAG: transglutaminase domain-containing protein [Clostridiales bacterium]|nr:transglutaminase domain-containing protein [Clostridiales bacterium]